MLKPVSRIIFFCFLLNKINEIIPLLTKVNFHINSNFIKTHQVWLRGSQVSFPTFSMQNFCGPLLPAEKMVKNVLTKKQHTQADNRRPNSTVLRRSHSALGYLMLSRQLCCVSRIIVKLSGHKSSGENVTCFH